MIGNELEQSGWRQGSIVSGEDAARLLDGIMDVGDDNVIVIIASQSCDIANNNLDNDPVIEVSIARPVQSLDGNYTFNKNPRLLHTEISSLLLGKEGFSTANIELKAFEKLYIDKRLFEKIVPDSARQMSNQNIYGYVSWLSARYSRPALPTEFNNRIDQADRKGKRKKVAKGLNKKLSGIYVEIFPEAEIAKEENYKVNLLGVIPSDYEGDMDDISASLKVVAGVMEEAGMDVNVVAQKENEISIATIKRFKRFYFDDLSIKEDGAPEPIETTTNL